MSIFNRHFLPACAAIGVLLAVRASGVSSPFHSIEDDVRDMTEFFDTVLPTTLQQYNLVLDFTPRFVDFRNREFVRYPLELRYAPINDLEIFGGLTPFSPNPINSGRDHRWGIGEAFFGLRKHVFQFWIFNQVTYGFETRIPFGNPPIDLIDGYLHVQPFFTVTRKLHWPSTEFYAAVSYDRAFNAPQRDKPTDPDVIHQHILEASPGILYKPSEYGYFVEYDFRHLNEDVGVRLSNGGRIGAIWDMPVSRSRAWRLPGKWQIEMALKVVKEEGRSMNYGIDTHIRVRTTLHEVLNSPLVNYLSLAHD